MKQLLTDFTTWAETKPDILALYLYGSQAEGRATLLSDVDIAILARPDLSKAAL